MNEEKENEDSFEDSEELTIIKLLAIMLFGTAIIFTAAVVAFTMVVE